MWRKCLGAFSARVAFSHLPGDTVAKVYEIPSTFAHNTSKGGGLVVGNLIRGASYVQESERRLFEIGLIVSEFKLVV